MSLPFQIKVLWPVWIKGGRRGSRVELAENKLILGQLYFNPLSFPQLKLTINE